MEPIEIAVWVVGTLFAVPPWASIIRSGGLTLQLSGIVLLLMLFFI